MAMCFHPGPAAPHAPALLDTYEALLLQALRTGRARAAYAIYTRSMGGFAHLGLRLGDMIRGARMLRAFARDRGPDGVAPALPPAVRSNLACEWGLYSAALGDLAFARRCYQAAIEIAREDGDPVLQATGLRTLAYTAWLAGNLDQARGCVSQSIALAEDLARGGQGCDDWVRGLALLGAVRHDLGEPSAAHACFARVRALGDRPLARRALWEARHHLDMGRHACTRELTEINLCICEALGWSGHVAQCHVLLGYAALAEGDHLSARTHLAQARTWVAATGEVETELRCRQLDARIALAEVRMRVASRAATGGLHLARSCGFTGFVPRLALLAGEAALGTGDAEAALAWARIAVTAGDAWSRADGHHLAGQAAQATGQREHARTHYAESARLREHIGHPGAGASRRALDALA